MQNFNIETDETGKELISHGDAFFPLAGYDEYFSRFTLGEVPWHWHDEVEFVVVLDGSTQALCVDQSVLLEAGQGIFINSGQFHRMIRTSKEDCHIINFVLKPELISGRRDSLIYQKYIQPLCSQSDLSFIRFSPEDSPDSEILRHIREAFHCYSAAETGFEIMVSVHLARVWYLMCLKYADLLSAHSAVSEDKRRISLMMQYIHSHDADRLTVPHIAAVAGVSESECYRLFRRTLHATPSSYILDHRLQKAAVSLAQTDASVLGISLDLGFGSPSYFSRKFREHYGMTPLAYRKARQEGQV